MSLLKRVIFIFFLSLSIQTTTKLSADNNPKVLFLNPGAKDDIFFKLMTDLMLAAAEDLKIEIEVVYCNRNHILLEKEGIKVLEREVLPEYLLLINEKNGASKLIPIADKKGVKVFLFNEGLLKEEKVIYGTPGGKYKNWVAQFLPDDFQAGYLLAKNLITIAEQSGFRGSDGYINIAGISGTFQTNSSSLRVQGLEKAVSEHKKTRLLQVAPAYYEVDRARDIAGKFLKRYPELDIIWSASDGIALGVIQAMEDNNLVPGKDLITGGIDWADFAIKNVEKGIFTSTVGGHFMDGGWVLIMLFDYHNGIPMEVTTGKTNFSSLKQSNITKYMSSFGSMNWSEIDFTKFSKFLNPKIKSYSFGVDEILKQQ